MFIIYEPAQISQLKAMWLVTLKEMNHAFARASAIIILSPLATPDFIQVFLNAFADLIVCWPVRVCLPFEWAIRVFFNT